MKMRRSTTWRKKLCLNNYNIKILDMEDVAGKEIKGRQGIDFLPAFGGI